MRSVQAAEPAPLKPGTLVGHLVRVTLVEAVLWVKYPYAALSAIPRRLNEASEEIDSDLVQLETEANKNITTTYWDNPLFFA